MAEQIPALTKEQMEKLRRLYELLKPDMFKAALSILKNRTEAQDIVSQAVLRIARHPDKFEEPESRRTKGYVITTVFHLAYDRCEKRRRTISLSEYREDRAAAGGTENSLDRHILKLALKSYMDACLERIKPSYALILTLRYYEEETVAEIAEELGITENNADVRLHRARQALGDIIAEEGDFID